MTQRGQVHEPQLSTSAPPTPDQLQPRCTQASRVPSLFRQAQEDSGRRPSTIIGSQPGQLYRYEHTTVSHITTSNNTQIYEGTNQIQRVVMARQLLKG
jgi:hypothetical protein